MDNKQYVSEILGMYKYKVDNNLCTIDEINSLARMFMENDPTLGASIADLAKFYNKPEVNIRATISRKLIAKPKRVILYPFMKFAKIVPDKWHKDNEIAGTK